MKMKSLRLKLFLVLFYFVTNIFRLSEGEELSNSDSDLLKEEVRSLNERLRQVEAMLQKQQNEGLNIEDSKSSEKRFVVDGEMNVEQEILRLRQDVDSIKQGVASTYVRWGRTTCAPNATLVYKGYTGGNEYTDNGGPANYVCLPEDPTWGKYDDGIQSEGNTMCGTEYELYLSFNPFPKDVHDEDAPCAVCRTPYETTIMIPARTNCYPGWHEEYTGYIMTIHSLHPAASEYICVDADPELMPHGSENKNGNVLYVVEAVCGSLPCLPYVDGRELACVVCSK